jgi:hypothetical protein
MLMALVRFFVRLGLIWLLIISPAFYIACAVFVGFIVITRRGDASTPAYPRLALGLYGVRHAPRGDLPKQCHRSADRP